MKLAKGIKDNRTELQKEAFSTAQRVGKARHFAEMNGGTGDLRRDISGKEAARLKSRRAMAKASRRNNRKGRR